MLARATLVILTAFWAIMNVLLWRAEFGGAPALGSSVPPQVVWGKILTAPDSSSLTIFYKGKKAGFCHWITSVSEDLSQLSAGQASPEGMVRKITGYHLELTGNIIFTDVSDRLRFDSHLSLDRKQDWKEFDLRVTLRPSTWELRSTAAEQTVRFSWRDDVQSFKRVFKFSELQNPGAVLLEFGGPLAAGALGGLLPEGTQDRSALRAVDLHWEARLEQVKLGHSSIRAYRLQTHLLDRYAAVVFVSRVGEILRVELPNGIVLANDQLGNS